jgi:SAM-dependent methyltransferase
VKLHWLATGLLALALDPPPAGAAPRPKRQIDPSLVALQSELASLDGPEGYYTRTYRPSETLYWSNLPGWMREAAQRHRAARVLDIGCGYGTLLAFATEIFHAQPFCIDVVHYIPQFGERYGFQFAQGNIQLDPIPWAGGFDVILMTEVLEHFNFEPLPTLKKIHDALKPDGVFYLTTPDADEWGRQTKYYSQLRDLPPADRTRPFIDDHVWVYSKKELLQLLKDAGFRVERFAYSPGVGHRHFNLELRRETG